MTNKLKVSNAYMEGERDYDNYGFDKSKGYFRRKKKVMMKIPFSLRKNQNLIIIKKTEIKHKYQIKI